MACTGQNIMTFACMRTSMRIEVNTGKSTSRIELPDGSSGFVLLDQLSLLPDAHILLRGKRPVPLDEPLQEGELIKIIKVASGG